MTPRRLCVLAFVLRIVGSLLSGHFLAYGQYYSIAQTVVAGGGYCMSPGRFCAFFPPVYPTILAACLVTGHFRIAVVVVSSLLGTGVVYLTWRIGERLFGRRTGLLAAAYCAVYPYYVWHDTVVQENVTLAFVVALSVWCLLHAEVSRRFAVAAGMVLGLCVLTKANLLLFAVAATFWVWIATKKPGRAAVVLLAFVLTLAPWLIRTERLTDSFSVYSPAGLALFTANSDAIFRYFPARSVDTARGPALDSLTEAERRELRRAGEADPNGIAESQWLWKRGMRYIEEHPWLSLYHGIRKVEIAFSPVFSPRKGWGEETVYCVSYLPVLSGFIAGLWMSRARWRELGYIYVLTVTFAIGTAVFWAHTSHRMFLDPYMVILSAYAVGRLGAWSAARTTTT